jgi:hypothetical protein
MLSEFKLETMSSRYGKEYTPAVAVLGDKTNIFSVLSQHFKEKESFVVDNTRQLSDILKNKRRQKVKVETLLLMDEPSEKLFFRTPEMIECVNMGNRYKLLSILSKQNCKDISPVVRQFLDFVFVTETEGDLVVRKDLWEGYCSIVPTFKLFNEYMNKYGCLVVDRTSVECCIFWYKNSKNSKKRKVVD